MREFGQCQQLHAVVADSARFLGRGLPMACGSPHVAIQESEPAAPRRLRCHVAFAADRLHFCHRPAYEVPGSFRVANLGFSAREHPAAASDPTTRTGSNVGFVRADQVAAGATIQAELAVTAPKVVRDDPLALEVARARESG